MQLEGFNDVGWSGFEEYGYDKLELKALSYLKIS